MSFYFSCTRCSSCCRYESGFVFVSESDLTKLCRYCNLEREQFISLYCRWVPHDFADAPRDGSASQALCLKEKSNFDCVFWTDASPGCAVYNARPAQCVTYPFWTHIADSRESWESNAAHCPGIKQGLQKKGVLHGAQAIAENVMRYKCNIPVMKKG